jgi:hypothetical protein
VRSILVRGLDRSDALSKVRWHAALLTVTASHDSEHPRLSRWLAGSTVMTQTQHLGADLTPMMAGQRFLGPGRRLRLVPWGLHVDPSAGITSDRFA